MSPFSPAPRLAFGLDLREHLLAILRQVGRAAVAAEQVRAEFVGTARWLRIGLVQVGLQRRANDLAGAATAGRGTPAQALLERRVELDGDGHGPAVRYEMSPVIRIV